MESLPEKYHHGTYVVYAAAAATHLPMSYVEPVKVQVQLRVLGIVQKHATGVMAQAK
jgi:hypothetical protein